jgi:hypothetical protein
MKPRLQLKPKNKVTVRTSMRLITVGAAFAVLVATGFFLYYNLGTSGESIAGKETQLPGFGYRKPIKFNNPLNRGSELLLNFPMLLSFKDKDLKHISSGGKVAHKRGYDIRITKKDGISVLPSSIESYNPTTGECNIWVLADSLVSGKAPEFMLYYSNAAMQMEPANLVWTDKFVSTWHLNKDFTGNGVKKLRATQVGTSDADGKIAGAKRFNNDNGDFAEYPFLEELNLKNELTVSAWIFPEQVGRNQVIISNHGDVPGGYSLYLDKQGSLNASFITSSGKKINLDNIGGAEKLEKGKWQHIAMVFSLSAGKLETFVNGISDRLLLTQDAPAPTSSPMLIGKEKFTDNSGFTGIIDEVKISSKARSKDWLSTEYYNQYNPFALYSLLNEEALQVDAVSLEKNRQAMQQNSNEQASAAQRMNNLKATKKDSDVAPSTITSSSQQMRDKMNNMRRVSNENSK